MFVPTINNNCTHLLENIRPVHLFLPQGQLFRHLIAQRLLHRFVDRLEHTFRVLLLSPFDLRGVLVDGHEAAAVVEWVLGVRAACLCVAASAWVGVQCGEEGRVLDGHSRPPGGVRVLCLAAMGTAVRTILIMITVLISIMTMIMMIIMIMIIIIAMFVATAATGFVIVVAATLITVA